jgi:ferredoxin hydrogenase large subunit
MARTEIGGISYELQVPGQNAGTAFLQIDQARCIGCDTCQRCCPSDAITGNSGKPHALSFPPACIGCGQCLAHCPQGAVYEDHSWLAAVVDELNARRRLCVAMPSPSVRYTLGEAFGMPPGSVTTGRLRSALRMLGFPHCWDVEFAADAAACAMGRELLRRLQIPGAPPLFTSSCPGWVTYCETFHPGLLPCLSACPPPEALCAALAKSQGAQRAGCTAGDIYAVLIAPCQAHKQHPLLRSGSSAAGIDAVLDARELAWLIRKAGIDLAHIPEQGPDPIMGEASGAATLFSAPGGAAEAILRFAAAELSGGSAAVPDFIPLRGMAAVREASFSLGRREVRAAVVNGAKHFPAMLETIRGDMSRYQLVEFTACPGGCLCGGGQPLMPAARSLFDEGGSPFFPS